MSANRTPSVHEESVPYTERHFGHTELAPSFRIDLRDPELPKPDRFIRDRIVRDWSQVTWSDVGRPHEVANMSKAYRERERTAGSPPSAHESWELFNRSFHEWFVKDVPQAIADTDREMRRLLSRFRLADVRAALGENVRLRLWNYVHRVEDGIWDPRGKRALFQGLDVARPRILFLGAAEGYEGMQLQAMYPGGEVVMVDYDEYCRTHRFAEFPERYPFLGANPATGRPRVWYKDQMNIAYVVEDIRKLPFGREFDIVLSVGLLEHFPDELKPQVMDWHRKFLKPGGYCIMTTPRDQLRSRLFYRVMEEVMNHTYRELMTIQQMGLYVYENGFEILRHGTIKAHNGLVARPR